FGVVPSLPLVLPSGGPPIGPVMASADRARIDAQMWQLDAQWFGAAQWASAKSCVRGGNAVPWSTLGADGCRNAVGSPVQPTCLWGFWRIDRCDLTTAGTLAFQMPRYLWAQAGMRELLATKPVQGATDAQTAADWTWKAAQLISAFLWSTNVRFDNPNAATR